MARKPTPIAAARLALHADQRQRISLPLSRCHYRWRIADDLVQVDDE